MVITQQYIDMAIAADACEVNYKVGDKIEDISFNDLCWIETNLPGLSKSIAIKLKVPTLSLIAHSGHGDGHLEGYGPGYGQGHGYGYGHGLGLGYGHGYGQGDGHGGGYAYGCSYGKGDGYGCAYGHGYGQGYG